MRKLIPILMLIILSSCVSYTVQDGYDAIRLPDESGEKLETRYRLIKDSEEPYVPSAPVVEAVEEEAEEIPAAIIAEEEPILIPEDAAEAAEEAPEAAKAEPVKAEPVKNPIQSSSQKSPTEVIHYPAKPSRYIPLEEYMDLMRKVPAGKVVTCKTVEAYFKKKYNVEVIVIEVQGSFLEEYNMTYPFWRELSANGQLYATTRFKNRDQQKLLLEQDGLEIIPCGANKASLKVKDYKEHLFKYKFHIKRAPRQLLHITEQQPWLAFYRMVFLSFSFSCSFFLSMF